jgi:polar amino acid transport system substrate-binding protein
MRIPCALGSLLRQLVFPAAILACFVNSAWAAGACKQLVASGNPEYPPYLWRDGVNGSNLVGANADLVQRVAKEIGIPIEVRYAGPWARVQEEARLGHIDLIAGAFFTVERLGYMDYVYPAFRETRSVVWERQAAPVNYRQWSDLRNLSGITVINNSFGEDFDRYAKKNLKINTVPSLEQAFKILQLGRVDYLVYEEDPGRAYIAKFAIPGLVSANPSLTNESLYLTLSHNSPCNTSAVRAALAKAMYDLAKQGVMKKMVESNIQLWRTK